MHYQSFKFVTQDFMYIELEFDWKLYHSQRLLTGRVMYNINNRYYKEDPIYHFRFLRNSFKYRFQEYKVFSNLNEWNNFYQQLQNKISNSKKNRTFNLFYRKSKLVYDKKVLYFINYQKKYLRSIVLNFLTTNIIVHWFFIWYKLMFFKNSYNFFVSINFFLFNLSKIQSMRNYRISLVSLSVFKSIEESFAVFFYLIRITLPFRTRFFHKSLFGLLPHKSSFNLKIISKFLKRKRYYKNPIVLKFNNLLNFVTNMHFYIIFVLSKKIQLLDFFDIYHFSNCNMDLVLKNKFDFKKEFLYPFLTLFTNNKKKLLYFRFFWNSNLFFRRILMWKFKRIELNLSFDFRFPFLKQDKFFIKKIFSFLKNKKEKRIPLLSFWVKDKQVRDFYKLKNKKEKLLRLSFLSFFNNLKQNKFSKAVLTAVPLFKIRREKAPKKTVQNFFMHFSVNKILTGIMSKGMKQRSISILNTAFLIFKISAQRVSCLRAFLAYVHIMKPRFLLSKYIIKADLRLNKQNFIFTPLRQHKQLTLSMRIIKAVVLRRKTGLRYDVDSTFSEAFACEMYDVVSNKYNCISLLHLEYSTLDAIRLRILNPKKSPYTVIFTDLIENSPQFFISRSIEKSMKSLKRIEKKDKLHSIFKNIPLMNQNKRKRLNVKWKRNKKSMRGVRYFNINKKHKN